MRDKSFMHTNQVFSGMLCQLREIGLDITKLKSTRGAGDKEKDVL